MQSDIVPVLLSSIEKGFKTRIETDRRILRVNGRIRDGTATLIDAHTYAERLGIDLSNALKAEITADVLPNGELYYNIAERIIFPTLETNYDMVNETARDIQRIVDRKNRIGLEAVQADFPDGRIRGLIDKLSDPEKALTDRLKWLGEPIVNNSEAFFDDYVDTNARTRSEVGLRATITRIVMPGCCKWCEEMEGTYEYGKEPKDIYRRHESCRCDVTYQVERTSQNVWTKQKWSTDDELEARRNAPAIRIRG